MPKSNLCKPEHCALREAAGIIRRVTPDMERERPSVGYVRSFPVVESTSNIDKYPTGKRLRIIDAPLLQNDAIYEQGYEPHVPELTHISEKLGAVFQSAAITGDISCSFYGMRIDRPETMRFRDNEGTLYEMLVSTMGSVVSVEKQHILTAVAAGHIDYAAEPAPLPRPDLCIDNVRYVGPVHLVHRCRDFVNARAKRFDMAFNVDAEARTQYTFLGVVFDHTRHAVRVADKTLDKLPRDLGNSIRVDELESLIGRVIHCSAVRQEPLVNHLWIIKWVRRVLNKLNRGQLKLDSIVAITDSALQQLRRWIESSREWHEVRRANRSGKSNTLYTDATLESWGAVLITDNARIFATGGHFDKDQKHGDIGRKEAFAVFNAITAFRDLLRGSSRLNLFVDNTSVVAGVGRGQVRAESLQEPVAAIWREIMAERVALFVDYVSTHINPADAISRGQTITVEEAKVKHGEAERQQNKHATRKKAGAFVCV